MTPIVDDLSEEEAQILCRVQVQGRLSASLYNAGIFSEPDFVLYGVMERLVIRRRLSYLGRSGDQQNAAYHYALPQGDGAAESQRMERVEA